MIYLTEKAANQIKEISEAESLGHLTVRVKVVGGGCAGFTNDMYFDDQVSEMDEVCELDGVKVVCDPLSFQYLDETTIDYVDGPFGAGFKFLNPNVKGSCGCGSSVSY
jgi:iron-sulfur cluster insertion protein